MRKLSKRQASILSVFVGIVLYAVFVSAYFFLVLHYLGGWVRQILASDRNLYAVLALALITAQGILLEMVTSALLDFVRRWFDMKVNR